MDRRFFPFTIATERYWNSRPLFHYEYPNCITIKSFIHQKFTILHLLFPSYERISHLISRKALSNLCIFQCQFWTVHQPSHHFVPIPFVPWKGTCNDLLHFHDRGHRHWKVCLFRLMDFFQEDFHLEDFYKEDFYSLDIYVLKICSNRDSHFNFAMTFKSFWEKAMKLEVVPRDPSFKIRFNSNKIACRQKTAHQPVVIPQTTYCTI